MPKIKTTSAQHVKKAAAARDPAASYARLCKAQILTKTDVGTYVPGKPLPALFRTPAAVASTLR